MKPSPCNECIITIMCRNKCDYLEDYLNEYLHYFPRSHEYATHAVASALRKEMIELYSGTLRGWRYVGKFKTHEEQQQRIERQYYGQPM